MPKTVTIEKTIYQFSELDESAKEYARNTYREHNLYYDWWEFVYEDAATIADILGIDLRQRAVKLMNGETRFDPDIYFSGFWSQGDGASFAGTYSYKKGAAKRIREYAPKDKTLHEIADTLQTLQRKHFYQLSASISHHGRYYSINVDVSKNELYCYKETPGEDDCETLRDCMRDFASWIYSSLESEYEYLQSDEVIDESIEANECVFDEQGLCA